MLRLEDCDARPLRGRNPQEAFFVLAGVAMFERSLYHFISSLDQVVERFGLPDPSTVELHGSAMYNGRKEFGSIMRPEREKMIHDALGVITDRRAAGVSLWSAARDCRSWYCFVVAFAARMTSTICRTVIGSGAARRASSACRKIVPRLNHRLPVTRLRAAMVRTLNWGSNMRMTASTALASATKPFGLAPVSRGGGYPGEFLWGPREG
jgi:hypothetical protein